jgi:hypothetical protein
MYIYSFYLKQDKTDIFIKTTGTQGNMKRNGTIPFKTVRMASLVIVH